MHALSFYDGKCTTLEAGNKIPDSGFIWLDFCKSEDGWKDVCDQYIHLAINEHHLSDIYNDQHPPFYDSTDEYEILIFRSVLNTHGIETPQTLPVTFLILENCLISIRSENSKIFKEIQDKLSHQKRRTPRSIASLLHLLIDSIIDEFLDYQTTVLEKISEWQDRLLDRNDVFDDWESLMRLKSRLRRMEVISSLQLTTLSDWEEQTSIIIDPALSVRFTDLKDHMRRVLNQVILTQHDIDSLVQIYFSATTQRTNEILQVLAIISAIFLPLNLVAGIFGMNFKNLPFINHPVAPYLTITFMLLLIGGLLITFKKKKWIQ